MKLVNGGRYWIHLVLGMHVKVKNSNSNVVHWHSIISLLNYDLSNAIDGLVGTIPHYPFLVLAGNCGTATAIHAILESIHTTALVQFS